MAQHSERAALRLCDLLLRREPGTTAEFGALEQSSLKEAGNILCGAFMTALSSFMGMMLLPSVPTLVVDLSAAVLTSTYLDFGSERDYVLCVLLVETLAGGRPEDIGEAPTVATASLQEHVERLRAVAARHGARRGSIR